MFGAALLHFALICRGDADFERLRAQMLLTILPAWPPDVHTSAQVAAIDREVPSLVSSLNSSGLWPDVNYTYSVEARDYWPAAVHLQRALMLTISAASNASTHYGSAAVASAGSAATAAWVSGDFSNSNWWWMQFGLVNILGKLLIVAPNSTTLFEAERTIFSRLTIADVRGFVGANRVWAALATALVGLASANISTVDAAFALMDEAYAYAPPGVERDGLQADGAFHQHGPLAYFSYGYGAHFLATALTAEAAAAGTRWAMSPPSWAVVARYLLDGARWVTRGAEFHLGASGRHNVYFPSSDAAGVTNGHYHFFAAYIAFAMAFPAWLAPLDSALAAMYARLLPPLYGHARGDEVRAFHDQVMSGGGGVAGHARFWRTDYSVHARPAFSFSLHTFSNRTLNSECVNGEGVQNRGMADGLLTLHVSGREYRAHPPVWRWSLVPGATALQGPVYTCANAQVAAERAAFVGGVTDGWLGAACQDLHRIDGGHALDARKAWFFVEGGAIALGAGIASDGALNVATAVEQRLRAGEVWVALDGAPSEPIALQAGNLTLRTDIAWVWHDGVATAFLARPAPASASAAVGVSNRDQSGSLAAIVSTASPAPITLPTFLLYIHHGAATAASAGSYAYAVLPSVSSPAAAAAAVAALTASTAVVANSADVQAVCASAPNASTAWMLEAVFWPPPPPQRAASATTPLARTLELAATAPCAAVSVDSPALILVSVGSAAAAAAVRRHEGVTGAIPRHGNSEGATGARSALQPPALPQSLVVTASSPLAVASVDVTVSGVIATGAACRPAPAGSGTIVAVALPTGDHAGSSSTVTCIIQPVAL